MSFIRIIPSTCALAVCCVANSAAADLSAAQVWGDWRTYLEGMGYSVSATEASSGDTLSVSEIVVQTAPGPDGGTVVLRMGPLQFVESAGGTVEVVMPQSMPLMVDITPGDDADAEPVQMTLNYTQSGQQMVASGDPAQMVYDYTAESFGIALADLTVDGVAMDASAARLAVAGDTLQSQTKVSLGDTRSYDQNVTLGNLVYEMFFKDPDSVEAMQIDSSAQNLAFAGITTLPLEPVAETQDMTPLLAAGFAAEGTFTAQGSENRIEVTSEEGISRIKTGSTSATLGVAMAPEGMRYDMAAEEMELGAELAGLPFPLYAQMAGAGFALRAPVMQSDDPQDFALAMNFTDFTMSDIIWALFDPEGQLPRDPATIALDLNGKANVLADPLDTDRMQQMATGGTPPAEVSALDISRLTIDAVGAKIDATGAFTFDNTDKVTLPGFPKPVGDINISIAGANALMDKLVAMGFLPPDQVMGARMMLGMFAVPGAEPDTLNSRIEFNDEGQILANGQRIR